jgi:hypothetical protein
MGDEQTPKMAANPSAVARAGAQRRLMDYLGLSQHETGAYLAT